MQWKWIRPLVWRTPEDYWGADPIFIVVAIALAVIVARVRGSVGLAIGTLLMVVALRHLLFFLVRRGRRRG